MKMKNLTPVKYVRILNKDDKTFKFDDLECVMPGYPLQLRCNYCGYMYEVNLHYGNGAGPAYCPWCGVEYDYSSMIEPSAESIKQAIKNEFHGDGDENKMEKLLNDLTELAKKGESKDEQ